MDESHANLTPSTDLLVWLGKFQLDKTENDSVGIAASDIIVHPDWSPASGSLIGDIAIILLDIVADLTPNVQVVALPAMPNYTKDDDVNEDGFVVIKL